MSDGCTTDTLDEFIEHENIHDFAASIDDPLISSIDTCDTTDIATSQETDSIEGLHFAPLFKWQRSTLLLGSILVKVYFQHFWS